MQVALTVDAEHPDNRNCSAGNPSRLVDLLHDRGAPASFFIQGRWALANPDLLTRIAGDGHLLGNHSHFHTRLPQLTAAGLRADVGDAAAAITAITGVDTRPWFRCPFGDGGLRGYVEQLPPRCYDAWRNSRNGRRARPASRGREATIF